MRLFLLATLLVLIGIANALNGFRGSKFRQRGRDRGRCPQLLPRPMDLDVFRRRVQGDGYSLVLIKPNFPIDLETDLVYNVNILFDNETDTNVFSQKFVFRFFGDTTNGDCFAGSNVFTAKSPDLAVFDSANEFFGSDFQISYFSSRPSDYIIEVGCNVTSDSNFDRQCCSGSYFVAVCSSTYPPHFFPWKSARRDLRRGMGIDFSDFFFNQLYTACEDAAP